MVIAEAKASRLEPTPKTELATVPKEYLINIVAVDFDDTLSDGVFDANDVEGCTYSFNHKALAILIQFQQRGGKVIVWTCREGAHKAHALRALRAEGFYPDYVNEDTKEIQAAFGSKEGHKVYADLYIDDRNTVDRKVDWDQISEWFDMVKTDPLEGKKLSLVEMDKPTKPVSKGMISTLLGMKNESKDTQTPKPSTTETMQDKARRYVMEYFNTNVDASDSSRIGFNDTYLVWFSKTIQNWKALVGTTVSDGMYYEVTYNGDEEEAYIDAYKKVGNVKVSDEVAHVRKVVYIVTVTSKGKSKVAKPNQMQVFDDKAKALLEQHNLFAQGVESTLQIAYVK